MSAERSPSCGLAERVLSTFTASTGPSAAARPVKGCVRTEGAGVAGGREADVAGGGGAVAAVGGAEQAARAAPTSAAARAGATRELRTSWTSSDKSGVLGPRG